MRILLDECSDPGIRDFLTGHQITTVGEDKLQSSADNQLTKLAEVILGGGEQLAIATNHDGVAQR